MHVTLVGFGYLRIPRTGWIVVAVGLIALSQFLAMQTTNQLVIYRTDARQAVMCRFYFWVGAVSFRYKISRIFSMRSITCAVIVWLSLSRWPEIFVIASCVMLSFVMFKFGLARSPRLSRMASGNHSSMESLFMHFQFGKLLQNSGRKCRQDPTSLQRVLSRSPVPLCPGIG